MMQDIGSLDKPLVGSEIGSYNRKFAEKYTKQLLKVFGENAVNVGPEGKMT
jgi:hypothetical protein